MPTFDDQWDDLTGYFAEIFFTELNKKVDGVAVDLKKVLETEITKSLDNFFRNLANQLGDWATEPPDYVMYHSGSWIEYAASYYKFKKVADRGEHNWFALSELPRIRRNSRKSRSLRRRQVKSAAQLKQNPSLRMLLRNLDSPTAYWGDVTVDIWRRTNTDGKDGKRRYNKGVERLGVNKGGQIMKSDADFLTLSVHWLPMLNGMDLLERGVTERRAPGHKALPGRVTDILENHEHAYRPLLGPYILWYQDTVIKKTMKNITDKYGAQL